MEFVEDFDPLGHVQPLGPIRKDRRRLIQPFLDLRTVLHRHFPHFFSVEWVKDLKHHHDLILARLPAGGQSRVIILPQHLPLP